MAYPQRDPKSNIYYTATAGDNKVVTTGPAFLERIIIPKYVASGVIEVSDHASDGDGNVKLLVTGSATVDNYPQVIEVGANFDTGLTVDITNYTNISIVWKNA